MGSPEKLHLRIYLNQLPPRVPVVLLAMFDAWSQNMMQVKSPKMMATKNISTSTGVKWHPKRQDPKTRLKQSQLIWNKTKCSTQQNKSASFLTWTKVRSWNENESQQKPYPLPTFLHLNVLGPFLKELHGAFITTYHCSLLPPTCLGFGVFLQFFTPGSFKYWILGEAPTRSDGLFLEVVMGHLQNRKNLSLWSKEV